MKINKSSNHLFAIIAFAILLSSCQGIPLKNQTACSVAGIMAAGMNCAHTLEGDPFEMNLEQTIAFLEPSIEENRSGAICMSAEDFNSMKTTIDVVCEKLGSACKPEFKNQISKMKKNLEVLEGPTIVRSNPDKPSISRIPAYGEKSSDVEMIQSRLNILGFDAGSIDGEFGKKTLKAIKALQKQNGLKDNGVIDESVLNILGIDLRSLPSPNLLTT